MEKIAHSGNCFSSGLFSLRYIFSIFLGCSVIPFSVFSQTGGLVMSGSNVRMVSSGNVYVVLTDAGWTNNASAASFVPGTGTVTFAGSTGNAQIGGSVSTAFYTLQSNKPGQELRLAADVSASNRARLVAGNVNLQDQTLDLQGTGNLEGEVYPNGQRFYCADNRAGRIRANRTLVSGTNADIAGLALDLNVSGTAPGSTVLYRGHDAQTGTAPGAGTSIGRYYDITPTVSTGFTYTFVFRYHEQELGMVVESDFVLYRSPSYAANTADWQEWGFGNGPQSPGYPTVGLAVHDAVANTVTLTGINSFSRWTTSNALVDPLPVNLLTFGATCEENQARLHWTTASELNNEKFVLERSADLQTWKEIATLPGAGNSNALLNYHVTDERPLPGMAYYRLTQIDYDGAFETFTPTSVNCQGTETGTALTVYPNPAAELYTVSVQSNTDKTDARILLIDINGKVLQTRRVVLQKGRNDFLFDRTGTASGTYTVWLKSADMPPAPAKLILY